VLPAYVVGVGVVVQRVEVDDVLVDLQEDVVEHWLERNEVVVHQ